MRAKHLNLSQSSETFSILFHHSSDKLKPERQPTTITIQALISYRTMVATIESRMGAGSVAGERPTKSAPRCAESSKRRRCEDPLAHQAADCPEVNKSALHEIDCGTVRVHGRSLSYERRKAESAQFFKVVRGSSSSIGTPEIEIVDSGGEDSQDDEHECIYEIRRERKIPQNRRRLSESRFGSGQQRFIPFQMLPASLPSFQQSGPVREDLNYRGIGRTGLEITKCGIQRGNHVTLHRKAWLEVSDLKHRYGKNLRVYYRHWCSLGYPTNNFFHWLDSEDEAEGHPLPDLQEFSRKQLESDTVLYITDEDITGSYCLSVVTDKLTRRAKILDVEGEPVRTGKEGWIFVLRDNALYGSRKVTILNAHSKQRFHHSSFFGGKAVSAAGILVTDQDGYLTEVHPHSGHYRPGESDMQRCLYYLYSTGVDFDTFQVDMQQIFHVSRHVDAPMRVGRDAVGKSAIKKQKKSCLLLKPACFAAYFLSHKAKANEVGIFTQIQFGQTSDDPEAPGGGSRNLSYTSPIE
jgi:hypothetical protein